MIDISNIFEGDFDKFVQIKSVFFEMLKISQSDILDFEIKNGGFRNVNVVVMFSEDLKKSNLF